MEVELYKTLKEGAEYVGKGLGAVAEIWTGPVCKVSAGVAAWNIA